MASDRGLNKKLIAAGEYIATPADKRSEEILKELDEDLEDAVFMGANREWYKSLQHEREGLHIFKLYQENVEAYNLFQSLFTQRNYSTGTGKFIGLKYQEVRQYIKDYYPKKRRKDLFLDLQCIEKGMVIKSNEKDK